MKHYYNTKDIMNYKGNSLDWTDIEGASAGTGAEAIHRFRQIPLNPLEPVYDYPGDTEFKGIPSRRQLIMRKNTPQKPISRNSTMSRRRLLQSIRNSKVIKDKMADSSFQFPNQSRNKFMGRNKSVSNIDKHNLTNTADYQNNLNNFYMVNDSQNRKFRILNFLMRLFFISQWKLLTDLL